ncbi:MAG TPA: energy transducer TonB [Terracidiphilus sp.]|nr:energy transducer TonB [Terracidiphilus sp.]
MTPQEKNDQPGAGPEFGHDLDAFLGKAFEEKPVWVDLWENVRDVFFPVKLPPLQLTSTPIPVPDRMAVKPNPWAIGISTTVNLTILLIVLFFVGKKVIETVKQQALNVNIDISDYNAPKSDTKAGGGGGGGDRSPVDANKGKLPVKAPDPVTPPTPVTIEHPKLPEPPAINVQKDIQLPDNNMPLIGLHNSPNVTMASAGQGNGAGMGTGSGGGLGSGYGNGYGPGYGGNTGGGVYQVGGRISAPVPIFQPEAEFSDEARRAKYQGVCIIALIVDAQGNPQNVHVIRTLGMGLDEKAMEAVRKYKFKPALKDGKTPVPTMITVEVDFHLY